MFRVRVQQEDFDQAAESAAVQAACAGMDMGALVAFVGFCRSEDDTVAALELEHYPGMAEAEIEEIIGKAREKWGLFAISVVHRFGKIDAGERIVFVAAAGRRRAEAFAGAEFIMDYLKVRAPFWKREIGRDGRGAGWVEAKSEDDGAADRWRAK